ncbi:MAG: YkgJ family cysteine cluster protein [Ectothiorhodospiraceae bacterium]|nr:YkgJ family cysteine cluster protein [Ectothiorhodospiraceae bacterium]
MKAAGIVKKSKQKIKSRFSPKANGEFMLLAIEVFHQSTDELITQRSREMLPVTFDCAKGCDMCCHSMRVEALPPEVYRITEYLQTQNDTVLQNYIARLETHATYAKGRSYRDYQTRCPFLGDGGACSIYEVRPHKCRAHLSKSKKACEIPGGAQTDSTLQYHEDALAIDTIKLYKTRKVSMNPAELGQAVLQVLKDDGHKARWLAGEEVFDSLPEGITV